MEKTFVFINNGENYDSKVVKSEYYDLNGKTYSSGLEFLIKTFAKKGDDIKIMYLSSNNLYKELEKYGAIDTIQIPIPYDSLEQSSCLEKILRHLRGEIYVDITSSYAPSAIMVHAALQILLKFAKINIKEIIRTENGLLLDDIYTVVPPFLMLGCKNYKDAMFVQDMFHPF